MHVWWVVLYLCTCVCVGELRVEVLIWWLWRGQLLLQTQSWHQLLKKNTSPVTVPTQAAHNVIRWPTCTHKRRGGQVREQHTAWHEKLGTLKNASADPRLWSTGRTVPRWQTADQTVWWTDSSTDRRLCLQSPSSLALIDKDKPVYIRKDLRTSKNCWMTNEKKSPLFWEDKYYITFK